MSVCDKFEFTEEIDFEENSCLESIISFRSMSVRSSVNFRNLQYEH